MKWALWGALLVLQNASFTWVSRARNSGSIGYHAVASVFSNGIWIVSQFIIIDSFMTAQTATQQAVVAAFYVVFTVTGSVTAHYVLMHHVERGKRRVGS